jgi:hypothetical protein
LAVDAYGCTNFSPDPEEGRADMEARKEEMKTAFRRKSSCDIKKLVQDTYPLIREDVLKGANASSLLEEWPFLFTMDGLATCFQQLTSIDLRVALGSEKDSLMVNVVKFMEEEAASKPVRQLCSRRVTPALAKSSQLAVIPGMIMLVCALFREDLSLAIIEQEVSLILFFFVCVLFILISLPIRIHAPLGIWPTCQQHLWSYHVVRALSNTFVLTLVDFSFIS